MNIEIDTKGNKYIQIENVRITYVNKIRRPVAKNWSNQDVIRIQALKDNGGLHIGAEYPIYNNDSIPLLVSAIVKLNL